MSKNTLTPGRKGFIFYRSFLDGVEALPEPYRLPLYEAIARYALLQEEPDFTGKENSFVLVAVWATIRPVLEKDIKHFLSGCEGGPHGQKGGAPRGNQNARKQPQNNPKTTANPIYDERCRMNDERCRMNDGKMKEERNMMNDVGNEATASAPKSRKRFLPPSFDEVKAYAIERDATPEDAEAFHDHYTANGWKSGKASVVDWKAAFRSWMRKDKEFKTPRPRSSSTASRIEIPAASIDDYQTNLF